jgi:hypothetical protein
MKKLLMASAVLFLFSASIMMFQISCSKTASAGTNSTNSTFTKVFTQYYEVVKSYNISGTSTGSFTVTKPSNYPNIALRLVGADNINLFFSGKPIGSPISTINPQVFFKTNHSGGNPTIIITSSIEMAEFAFN